MSNAIKSFIYILITVAFIAGIGAGGYYIVQNQTAPKSNAIAKQTYLIDYNLDGGINSSQNVSSYDGGDVVIFYEPERHGYIFDGWYTENSFENRVTKTSINDRHDITLYAKWVAKSWIIDYIDIHNADNSKNPRYYSYGEDYVFAEPTRIGYSFKGFYLDSRFTHPITQISSGEFEQDLKVYAKWEMVNYTIKFMVDGSLYQEETYNVSNATSFVTPAVPEKQGYTGSWESFSLNFANTETVVNAIYTVRIYTITYVIGNRAVNNSANPVAYSMNSNPITLQNPTRERAEFVGWYTDSGYLNPITEIIPNDESRGGYQSHILYAKWNVTFYVARFIAEGFSDIVLDISVDNVDTIQPPEVPHKIGYKGVWKDFTGFVLDDIVVHAEYSDRTYTITYNVGDGLNSAYNPGTYTINSADITLFDPTLYGYDFLGWYTEDSYENQVTRITHLDDRDYTLYAKWQLIEWDVVYYVPTSVENSNYTKTKTVRVNMLDDFTVESGYTYTGYGYIDYKTYNVEWFLSFDEATPTRFHSGDTFKFTNRYSELNLYASTEGYYADEYVFEYTLSGEEAYIANVKTSRPTYLKIIDIPKTIVRNNFSYSVTKINCAMPYYANRVFIPGTVTTISNNAFSRSKGSSNQYLNYVKIEKDSGLTSIGASAFANNHYLKSFALPNSVTSIGASAFENCYRLDEFVTPTSLTSIGESAFANCFALTRISLPSGLTSIGANAFSGCYRLVEVSNLSNLIIAKGEDSFGGVAKYAVRLVDDNTSKLVYLGNDDAPKVQYLLLNDDTYMCVKATTGSVTLDDNCSIVNDYAFYSNGGPVTYNHSYSYYSYGADKVTIPASVKVIGKYAFNDEYLTSVTFVGDSTLESIGEYAFVNSRITSIKISSSVRTIGKYAFNNCSLSSVTIAEESNLESIGEYAFANSRVSSNLVIPASVTSIGASAFSGTLLKSVSFGESEQTTSGLTTLPASAFASCTSLENITLPSNLTSIGANCFSGDLKLFTIVLPSGLSQIGGNAFNGCYRLVEVMNLSNLELTAGDVEHNGKVAGYALYVATSVEQSRLEDDEVNKLVYYKHESDDILVACYQNSSSTNVVIRNTCTAINMYAFYTAYAKNVTIPESVTTIRDRAFYYGYVSGEVIFDGTSSITSIGNYVFANCSLKSITIPESVTSFGNYAFSNCGLTSITIPESVTSFGDYAFSGCSLTSITIPESVTTLGAYAFSNCRLTSITIPNSVTTLGNNVFYNSGSLQTVTFAEGCQITNLPNHAFYSCERLKNIVLPNSLTSIGDSAFYSSGLTQITWSTELLSIGNYAFAYTKFENVVLPSKLVSIGASAFYLCTSLVQITIPNSVTTLGASVFSQHDTSYSSYENNNKLQMVVFEEGSNLTSIPNRAFDGCHLLDNLILPNSVQTIGDYAFSNCIALTNFDLPTSLTSIGERAFYYCYKLLRITIPSGVTSIGSSAFNSCYRLVEVINYSNQITVMAKQTGNGYVAYYALNVQNVQNSSSIITSRLSQEGNGVVYYNYGTVKIAIAYGGNGGAVVLDPGCTSINPYAFYKITSIASIAMGSKVTSIGNYAFYDCSNITSVSLSNALTKIGNDAFYHTKITSIAIPRNVETIGSSAFRGCGSLQTVSFDAACELKTIEACLFYDCFKLSSINLPAKITQIKSSAFSYCYALTIIKIPKAVTSIDSSAFYDCRYLTTVTVEKDSELTSIGSSAFNSCTRLVYVVIPGSVTSIGSSAFSGCNLIEKVYYGATGTQWNHISISSPGGKFLAATRYYYSETRPIEEGNYWYYDTNNNVVEW